MIATNKIDSKPCVDTGVKQAVEKPLGWLFGAMAGGMAFGSTLGVILSPFTGWRMLFVGVAAASVIVSIMLLRYAEFLSPRAQAPSLTLTGVFQGYRSLIANARGARTYIYVRRNLIGLLPQRIQARALRSSIPGAFGLRSRRQTLLHLA